MLWPKQQIFKNKISGNVCPVEEWFKDMLSKQFLKSPCSIDLGGGGRSQQRHHGRGQQAE
jgi:hypothetical protein